MRPYLKDGILHYVLTKTERKKLSDAGEMCRVIASTSPIDEELRGYAADATNGVSKVLEKTGWNAADVEQPGLPL